VKDRETAPYRRIADLERENAALKEDQDRLDWLETPTGSTISFFYLRDNCRLTRAAIDAARKEKE
jgi:hypothetical protein